jgi:Ca2+-binding EF-hand superfamily protein
MTTLTVSYPLRALRVFRVLRVLRTVRFFHELRILCHSLFNGLISLFWAMLLVFLFSYITAVFLTDIIHSHRTNVGFDPADLDLASNWVGDPELFVDLYFGSLGRCMLTLFQIITLESWTNGIARPAEALVPGIIWIFVGFVLFMTFGLMNIVVGVFVEGSISTAAADAEHKLALKEAAFHNLLNELREVFLMTDQDGNGQLTIQEFESMKDDERIVKLMAEMDMVLTTEQFFEALDLDGQGSVTIDEFVQGVLRYQATPTNLDVYTVLGHVQRIHELVKEISASVKVRSTPENESLESSIAEMKKDIAEMKAFMMQGRAPQAPEEVHTSAEGLVITSRPQNGNIFSTCAGQEETHTQSYSPGGLAPAH